MQILSLTQQRYERTNRCLTTDNLSRSVDVTGVESGLEPPFSQNKRMAVVLCSSLTPVSVTSLKFPSSFTVSGDNGGREADIESALFIFSSDNACPDTER